MRNTQVINNYLINKFLLCQMIWLYQGKVTFVNGSVPPDENTTENYHSSGSSDNKSSDTGQEMNSLKHRSNQDVSLVFLCTCFLFPEFL